MEKKTLNVLILGQSGVGKSTWINSIFNYFKYETLDDAVKYSVQYVIPTSFMVTNDKMKSQKIVIGKCENECFDDAQSRTMRPQMYVFEHEKMTINVLDVPGIDDSRGIQFDKKNMRAILDHLSLFDEIHGICILLNSTAATLNTNYQFCMNELLMNLHKKSVDNIFFVFTHCAQLLPENGLTVLNEYLKTLKTHKGIDIRANQNNVYCINNDAFRFICACEKNNEQYKKDNVSKHRESWKKSRDATMRLFRRISKTIPQNVKELLSINQARVMINTLIDPLATITALIQSNTCNFQQNKDEIVDKLRRKLEIKEYSLTITKLNHPRTVCQAPRCTSVESIDGHYVTRYKQICHDNCTLKGIVVQHFPEEKLKQCYAMRRFFVHQDICQECKCSYKQHMHFDFEQQMTVSPCEFDRICNPNEQSVAGGGETDPDELVSTRISKLINEQKMVTMTMLKFAAFLKQNSIFEYNDVYEAKVLQQLELAKRFPKTPQTESYVQELKSTLDTYIRGKRDLKAVLETENDTATVSPADIENLCQTLFRMPKNGQVIKRLYDLTIETTLERNNNRNSIHRNMTYPPL